MRVLVVVPTLGKRQLEPLLRILASECASVADAGHECTGLVLHNGVESQRLAGVSSAARFAYANHEPLGYSEIRNEAIRRAVADAFDALVMVDDDELPRKGWLAALLAPFDAGADVVVGPVVTLWPEGAPARYVRSGLPRSDPNRSDGWIDIDLRSGNCAVRVSALGPLRFDDRFNASGGEDTALFRQLRASGGRCFWARSAEVAEVVDRDRLRLRYFGGRARQQGRTLASIQALLPRIDDVRGWAFIRNRAIRVVRLLWWAVSRRNAGHLLAAACEIAFVAGYAGFRNPKGVIEE